MQPKRPLGGDRVVLLETIASLEGEGRDLAQHLDRVDPDMVAFDVLPDQLHKVIAHVRHDTGIEVTRWDEVWTNCLAAFASVDPYGEYARAAKWAIGHEVPLAALNRDGKDLRKGKKRRLERDLKKHPIEAQDLRGVAMSFRERLRELGLLDRVEEEEKAMGDVLWDLVQRHRRVACVIRYPTSEEIGVRVRGLAERGDPARTSPEA